MSLPGPAPSVYSPFSRWGIPQANSITSIPRWMSPLESAITLPCSSDSMRASSSMFFSTSALKLNITRARRCGLTLDHSGKALSAASTARRISPLDANGVLACISPVDGLKTSPKRPDVPAACWAAMKWVSSFMIGPQPLDLVSDGAILAADAVEGEAGLRVGCRTGEINVQRVLARCTLRLAAVAALRLLHLRLAAGEARARRHRTEIDRALQRRATDLVLIRRDIVEHTRIVAEHADQMRMLLLRRQRRLLLMTEPPISAAREHQHENGDARDDQPRPLHENLREKALPRAGGE